MNHYSPFSMKLAFINPQNLFDAGSGAAQSARTMLEQMAGRGATCAALTACCFDAPPGASLPELLRFNGLSPGARIGAFDLPLWQGRVSGVDYKVIQLPAQVREQLSAIEELVFRDALRAWLLENRPDVVITYGGMLLDIEIQRCIHAAGALLVFYLSNPNYCRPETFVQVDLILANSSATMEHYARTMQLRSQNVGVFVDAQAVVAPKRELQFITFVNPIPAKGVALFLKLVQKAAREAPDMRFLAVESRGSLTTAMQKLGFPAGLMERIMVLPQQQHMAGIYAQTRILLMPSFWFEAAGRVLIEANANGIPVLASNRGGIPETLGGAGRLLPIPDRCSVDYWALPTDAEIQPWWEELLKLWREPAYRQELERKALAAAEEQSIARKADRLEVLLRAALADR